MPHEIVVYRNPADAIIWHEILSGNPWICIPILGFVGVTALAIIGSVLVSVIRQWRRGY